MNIKSYCISLKENKEERIRCQKIFDKYKLNVEFEIVDRSPKGGLYGCFESHINVLRKGIKHFKSNTNNNYIFIMEDDVYFEADTLFGKLEPFLLSLDNNTNWCYTLGYLTNYPSFKVKNEDIVKISNCQCTHAYLVPIHTAIKLSNMQYKGLGIDYAWLDVIDTFYAPYPMIAYQRDHLSSTSSGDMMVYMHNTLGFKNIALLSQSWSHHQYLFYSIIIILFFILFIFLMIYYKI